MLAFASGVTVVLFMLIVTREAFSYLARKFLISVMDSSLFVIKFMSSANCSKFISFLFGIVNPCIFFFFFNV